MDDLRFSWVDLVVFLGIIVFTLFCGTVWMVPAP